MNYRLIIAIILTLAIGAVALIVSEDTPTHSQGASSPYDPYKSK